MKVDTIAPPRIQQRLRSFAVEQVTENGQVTRARRWKLEPWADILHRAGKIGDDERDALNWYRDRFDAANYSPVRDSLDKSPGGCGERDAFMARVVGAKREVRLAEIAIPRALLGTLRMMALDDWTPTAVARERWAIPGTRAVSKWRIDRVMVDFIAGIAMLTRYRS